MTRGRAATPEPFDLGAVNTTDELFEALSARRFADPGHGEAADPAAMLLAALVADVDAGAPPLPAPVRVPCGIQGQYRRGVRAFVTFGVAALVLTSAGAAAAGGGGEGHGAMGAAQGSGGPRGSERSNENTQRHDPVGGPVTGPVTGTVLTGRRTPPRHADDRHRHDAAPEEDVIHRTDDPEQWGHRSHRTERGSTRPSVDLHHQSSRVEPRSPAGGHRPPSWPAHDPSDH